MINAMCVQMVTVNVRESCGKRLNKCYQCDSSGDMGNETKNYYKESDVKSFGEGHDYNGNSTNLEK